MYIIYMSIHIYYFMYILNIYHFITLNIYMYTHIHIISIYTEI